MRAQNRRRRAGSPPGKTPFFVAIALLAAACGGAVAQTTGAIPPASRSGAPSWSGQSGSSGDASMSAGAIRADAAQFHTASNGCGPTPRAAASRARCSIRSRAG